MPYVMMLGGIFLGGFAASRILPIIFRRYSLGLSYSQKYPILDNLKWMITNRELQKRLLITVVIMILIRIMFRIPLPGIDVSALQEFFSRMSTMLGVPMRRLTMSRVSIFALGIMPFISACLLVQLLTVVIPPWRRFSFGGEGGRGKIIGYTCVVAVVMSLIQSYFLSRWLETAHIAYFHGLAIVMNPGWGWRVVCMLTLTTSVMLLVFVANLINRYGLGNGVAIIITSALFVIIPDKIYSLLRLIKDNLIPQYITIVGAILFGVIIYVVFYVTQLVNKIKIRNARNEMAVIPFRPTIVGTIPLVWATSLALLPTSIAAFYGRLDWYYNSVLYHLIIATCIPLLTFGYVLIVFKPTYLRGLIRKYDYTIVSQKDEQTDRYFPESMSRVLIITAVFLLFHHFIARAIQLLYEKRGYVSITLTMSGVGVAAVIGVFSDILAQLNFFRKKESSGIKDWSACYVAFDEMEAEVKKEFLVSEGTQALIKPYRYTWGMPIRTAVDQYQIYVPSDKKGSARQLILERENKPQA